MKAGLENKLKMQDELSKNEEELARLQMQNDINKEALENRKHSSN